MLVVERFLGSLSKKTLVRVSFPCCFSSLVLMDPALYKKEVEIEVGCQVQVKSTKEKGTVEKRNFSNYLVNFGNKKAWRAAKELIIIPGIWHNVPSNNRICPP